MVSRILYILRFAVGLVFMLSGLLKATDAAAFANLMSDYGAEWFGYGAPLLIGIEILLGVVLIFNVRPRETAALTALFIFFVSAVYLYGVLALGMSDCGCFGPLTLLNSKPWLTFTRNAVLLALLIPSVLKPREGAPLTMPMVICMAFVLVILMFMCGWSLHGARCMTEHLEEYQPRPVSESRLAQYISTSPDSTYLVFAFSYGCPFCQNSVGNVNQYVTLGAVDKVIGLAVENPDARERFNRLFDVDFEIREISEIQMALLTNTLPTTFRIRHDTIVEVYSGLVLSPALFMP